MSFRLGDLRVIMRLHHQHTECGCGTVRVLSMVVVLPDFCSCGAGSFLARLQQAPLLPATCANVSH